MSATTRARGAPPDEIEEYTLKHVLGRGAMGQVWLAEDRLLGRLVAVKLLAAAAPSEAARARFFLEARAVARLSHPNVVGIYRVGEIDDRPYLVSEYVRGRSLADLDKPVPWQQALTMGIDLARGLGAAHRRSVLHRDIKPANAVMSDEGVVKLLDFGLAELLPEPLARETPASIADGGSGTSPGVVTIAGTPLYMAPEIWRGEPATRASDVFSVGVVLFELCAGRPPPLFEGGDRGAGGEGESSAILATTARVEERDPFGRRAPSLAEVVASVPQAFAEIVDRCLDPDPAARFSSGDALREALERLAAPGASAAAVTPRGPYRGLLPFEAEHRALFFGRSGEVRSILDRLRAGPFVLVAGDSGVGKSSLCRAGVLPAVDAGGLDARCAVVTVALGRQPLSSLAAALAPRIDADEATVARDLARDPARVARDMFRRPGRTLLFLDQLEELCTLAPPDEAAAVAEALVALMRRGGGVRVLATTRSDFLARLAMLPGLGDEVPPALFFVHQLQGDRLREAIVEPARAHGYAFESDAMVSAIIEGATGAGGGLPLLQFALTELWDARDEARRVIPAKALEAIGGVAGALARHADGVVSALSPATRDAARAILLRLVTADGTRARRTDAELVGAGPGGQDTRVALDLLVRGRLLVASGADDGGGTAYAIAHEALLSGWTTLQAWLRRDADARAIHQGVERAAADWERLGRPADALWAARRLTEAEVLAPARLAPREAAFLSASRRALRRRRARWAAAALAVPLAVGLAVQGIRVEATRALGRRVGEAAALLDQARVARADLDARRSRAFASFDASDVDGGETAWAEVVAAAPAVDEAYAAVCRSLELVLREDASRADARGLLGDALLDRAALAERDGRLAASAELRRRLEVEGDAAHRARATAHARLSITATPSTASITLARVELEAGRRVEHDEPLSGDGSVAPGSLVLGFSAPGRATIRLPIVVAAGDVTAVALDLPAASSVPPGFVFVPPGRFLWGTSGGEEQRAFFGGPPMHGARTGAFLIARDETTYADWIAFLRDLPEDERHRRAPRARDQGFVLALDEIADGGFELTFGPEARPRTARLGVPFLYPARHARVEQDWSRFPVSGVSFDDLLAYAAWLERTGRVPRARPCDEREWERAARGADGRAFPSGDRLSPEDANHDLTYGRDPLAFGPDAVGSHPASDSPFGIHDLAGNVWEWTTSAEQQGAPVLRGGSFYQRSLDSRCENRQAAEAAHRSVFVGVRVCATP
jgi:formylglycine-generating enzyme required for sulfatase activity